MTRKYYLNLLKTDKKLLNLQKSFQFLDLLLNQLKLIKKEKSLNSIKVIDYITDEFFYVDANQAQLLFDQLYDSYYYDFFLSKYESCRSIFKNFKNRTQDEKGGLIFLKLVLVSLKISVKLISQYIHLSEFFDIIKKNAKVFFDLNDQFINSLIKQVFEDLIEQKFFYIKEDKIFLTEDSIRLDLIVMSFLPVRINNCDSYIKYNCYYGLATLYFVARKYLLTANSDYTEYLLNKYGKDIEKFFLLQNNLEDYEKIDFSIFSLFKESNYDYILLSRIFIDKLILNEYFFQSIINCCFENYYFSNRINLMYGRNYELAQRLII